MLLVAAAEQIINIDRLKNPEKLSIMSKLKLLRRRKPIRRPLEIFGFTVYVIIS